MQSVDKVCRKCLEILGIAYMGYLWCENRKCKDYGYVVIVYIPIDKLEEIKKDLQSLNE